MKKFLSVLVAFCLMLTVMAVAFPVFAADTYTITFVYANDESTTDQYAAGVDIVYPALTASIYGDNVWSANENAYEEAPPTATGNITVYEYLREGVYEFDNLYKGEGAFRTGCGRRLNVADDNGKSVLKFENTELASVVNGTSYDDSVSPYNYNWLSYDRYNSIDLGTVPAGESKTYRITVAVKREASTLPLYLQAWTNSVSMNYHNSRTEYTNVKIPAVNENETKYTEYTLEFTTPNTLVDDADNTGSTKGNYLFLHVGSREAGECVAYIDYVKVEECVGSVIYNIPDNATVNGVTGDKVTINYYGDDVIEFPDVEVAEGYKATGWIDDETREEVETPEPGKSYTLVVNELVTVTLYRGGTTDDYKKEESVPKGSYYTLPDTEFTDTSWWKSNYANQKARFVGYEGEEVLVEDDVTFHTAEAYAKGNGASMYKNWTVEKDATEGLTYLHKTMEGTESATAWAHDNGTTRLCTRLGVVEDGNTYKISVTYKATTDTPLDFVMTISGITSPGDAMRNYLEEEKVFHTISKDTDGWETVTYYITADTPAKVTENTNGLDDTKDVDKYCALYLMVNKEYGAHNVEISIKKTEVVDLGKVVAANGASVLTKENEETAESQAIRYYFDYKTAGNGTTITIDGTDYPVVERGFIYTNGAITHYAKENVNATYNGYYIYNKGTAKSGFEADNFMMWLAHAKDTANADKLYSEGITEDLEKNWELKDGTVTFSTYVINIPADRYDAKIMVRGYVIFEDENDVQHIVYSETINRSVNGIKDAIVAGNTGTNGTH